MAAVATTENLMDQLEQPPAADVIAALHKAWSRADLARYLMRWSQAIVPPIPEDYWSFDWRALDLGCGFGKYILERSGRHPDRGYLGIDKGHLRGGNLVKRCAATGRANLFGLHGNAIPILAGMPANSVDEVTIFYPNPWWPPRHRKKRWSYHPLLPHLVALLKPGGRLILTSNEAFYLREWIYALSHHPALPPLALIEAGPVRCNPGRTHFETKFLTEGTPIGEVQFLRVH